MHKLQAVVSAAHGQYNGSCHDPLCMLQSSLYNRCPEHIALPGRSSMSTPTCCTYPQSCCTLTPTATCTVPSISRTACGASSHPPWLMWVCGGRGIARVRMCWEPSGSPVATAAEGPCSLLLPMTRQTCCWCSAVLNAALGVHTRHTDCYSAACACTSLHSLTQAWRSKDLEKFKTVMADWKVGEGKGGVGQIHAVWRLM
jgi:hypothetical protein